MFLSKEAMNPTVHAIAILLSLLLSWITSHHHHLIVYETWHTLLDTQVHHTHRKRTIASKHLKENTEC
jgi:hypothetical protein